MFPAPSPCKFSFTILRGRSWQIQECLPGSVRLTHCLLPSTLSGSIVNAEDQCQVQGTSDFKILQGVKLYLDIELRTPFMSVQKL